MKHLMTLAIRSLLARPGQNIVILFILAAAVFFASSAIAIFRATETSFDKMDRQLSRSHFLYIIDGNTDDEQTLREWWNQRPELAGMTSSTPVFWTSTLPAINSKEINLNFLVAEYDPNAVQDKIFISESQKVGESGLEPDYGEVWIPVRTAKTLKLGIGDQVQISSASGGQLFTVSALIIDPHFSSGMTNPVRVWVRQGSLPLFVPLSELNQISLGVRVKEGTDFEVVMADFKKEVVFSGWQLPYTLMKMSYLAMNNMIAGGLIIVSLIGVLLGLLIMVISITNTVRSDYRLIGVLKTLGYTPGLVTRFYTMQFVLLSILGLPLGLAAAFGMTKVIMGMYAQTVGAIGAGFDFLIPSLLTAAVLVPLTGLASFLSLRKAGKVVTIQAVRYGAPVSDERKSIALARFYERLGVIGGLCALFLTRNKRRTATNMTAILIIVFMAVMSLNFLAGFEQMKTNPANFGYDKRDMTLAVYNKRSMLTSDLIRQMVLKNEKIASVDESDFVVATVERDNGPDLVGFVYGGDWEKLGLIALEGTHPKNSEEIELAINTAKRLNLSPGGSLTLRIEGQLAKYTVSGIYQCVNNMGEGFRMRYDSLLQLNPFYKAKTFAVMLTQDAKVTEVADWLTQNLSSLVKVRTEMEGMDTISVISSGATSILSIIIAVFLLVSLLLIRNDIVMSINEEKKILGILKTTGYSTGQLRAAFIAKAVLTGGIAVVISLVVSLLAAKNLLDVLGSVMGLRTYLVFTEWFRPMLFSFLLVGFVSVIAWFASGCIRQLSPRILIVE